MKYSQNKSIKAEIIVRWLRSNLKLRILTFYCFVCLEMCVFLLLLLYSSTRFAYSRMWVRIELHRQWASSELNGFNLNHKQADRLRRVCALAVLDTWYLMRSMKWYFNFNWEAQQNDSMFTLKQDYHFVVAQSCCGRLSHVILLGIIEYRFIHPGTVHFGQYSSFFVDFWISNN